MLWISSLDKTVQMSKQQDKHNQGSKNKAFSSDQNAYEFSSFCSDTEKRFFDRQLKFIVQFESQPEWELLVKIEHQ